MRNEGLEWTVVERRRPKSQAGMAGRDFGRVDVARVSNKGQHDGKRTVSFYFTEFPDNFKAEEMLSVFQKFGHVAEVVIPPKRDKQGRRFGFARFVDVRDPHFFATKLDNIIIGRRKMFVNIPKFQREFSYGKMQQHGERKHHGERVIHSKEPMRQAHYFKKTEEKSYAHVVKKGVQKGDGSGVPTHKNSKGIEFAHLKFDVAAERVQQCSKAFVGIVSKPGKTYEIQEEFHKHGVFSIKVTPLGSNRVILEAEEDDEIINLVNNDKEWLLEWFEEIRAWSPREIDNERCAWIRCHGVPYHAWSEEFFSFLVSAFGEFVCLDDNTKNKTALDVARVMYRTKVHNSINRIVKVDINGEVFPVKMVEDWYGPVRWPSPCKSNFSDVCSSSDDDRVEDDMRFQADFEAKGLSDDEDDHNLEDHDLENVERVEESPSLGSHNPNSTRTPHVATSGLSLKQNSGNGALGANESFMSASNDNIGSKGVVQVQEGPQCFHEKEQLASMLGFKGGDSVHEGAREPQAKKDGPLAFGSTGPNSTSPSGPLLSHNESSAGPLLNKGRALSDLGPVESSGVSQNSIGPHGNLVHVGSAPLQQMGPESLPPICPFSISYCFPGEEQQRILLCKENGSCVNQPPLSGGSNFSGNSVHRGNSVSDSEVQRCNARFRENQQNSVAAKIWKKAKDLGVSGRDDDTVYVKKIGEMEARDCLAKSQREQQAGFP